MTKIKKEKKKSSEVLFFIQCFSGQVMLPHIITNIFITAPKLHQPGIEPGSVPWQGTILPLDHWCFDVHLMIMLLHI